MVEALSLGERAESWNAAVSFRLQLYILRRHQGRLAEIEEIVRGSVEDYPTYPIWRCVLAHMTAQLGHRDESQETLDALAIDDFAVAPLQRDVAREHEPAGRDRELPFTMRNGAAVLRGLLLPYADRVAVSHPRIQRGLRLLLPRSPRRDDRRLDRGRANFEDAIAMNERIGARPWLAHTQEEYARELIARGGSNDLEKAETPSRAGASELQRAPHGDGKRFRAWLAHHRSGTARSRWAELVAASATVPSPRRRVDRCLGRGDRLTGGLRPVPPPYELTAGRTGQDGPDQPRICRVGRSGENPEERSAGSCPRALAQGTRARHRRIRGGRRTRAGASRRRPRTRPLRSRRG